MTAFVTSSFADVLQLDGVYAVEVPPPAPITQPGQDWLGYVAQFAWGPVNTPIVIDSQGTYLDTFAPGGAVAVYGYTGHRGIARTLPANLKIVRVAPAGFSPPAAPVITQGGAAGAGGYSYKVVALCGTQVAGPVQNTGASPAGTTATGNATLSGANFNIVTWAAPAGAIGITGYAVYRTVGGATQGLIGTVAPGTLTFNDTGLAGDGTTPPTQNTTINATAQMNLQGTGAIDIVTVTAKYAGGLPITLTVTAADDAIANHFNLQVAAGTDIETYRNLSLLTGSVAVGDQSRSKYLAPLAPITANLGPATRPVNGTYTLGLAGQANTSTATAGADGIVASPLAYTGTAGAGDAGLAKYEGDPDVTLVCGDDCGNAQRVAWNSALVAHAIANNRFCVINDNSGTPFATVLTDIATNANAWRAERAILAWPWANTLDESGNTQLVPPAAFVAAALTHMPRHLGTHWKDARNTQYYRKITSLEFAVGRANLILAKNAGIEVLTPTDAGGIAPKSGITTSLQPGQQTVARRRLADFIIKGLTAGQQPYEGGPMDPVTRAEQRSRAKAFLRPLKDSAANGNAAITEAIQDFLVWDASSPTDIAAGLNRIGVKVLSFATQDFIAFVLQVGPTVTVDQAPVQA